MDSQTGKLYPSKAAASIDGVKDEDLVQMTGTKKAIFRVARKVRFASKNAAKHRKARQKMAKKSRKGNR